MFEKPWKQSLTAVVAATILITTAEITHADITWTGDLDPADPTTWTSDTMGYVGKIADGTLTVDGDSHLLSQGGFLGLETGVAGEVNVHGNGSTWINKGILTVGNYGNGTLNITSDGTVDNAVGYIGDQSGSTGQVIVDGDGSSWTNRLYLWVGCEGNGILNITGGGTVSSGGIGYIGYQSGSSGQVTVDGAKSTLTNNESLYVGFEGSGVLNVTGGGAVTSNNCIISSISGTPGQVTVDGAGSIWTNRGIIDVGSSGSGTLMITNGGTVLNLYGPICFIARNPGSAGEVTVDGAGSTWINSGNFEIGSRGNGALNITGGGIVRSGMRLAKCNTSSIGMVEGSTGKVNVNGNGSAWMNNTSLYVGGSGTLNITNGGEVMVEGTTSVTRHTGSSSGMIHFDEGTLTTGELLSAADDLTGTGTIITHGLISDVNLIFDATHGLSQTFSIHNNPGQNIEIDLNVDGTGQIGVGFRGSGKMHVTDGIKLESTSGYIGYNSGSMGMVTVNGAGSTWMNRGSLSVGLYGSGVLNICNGGLVKIGDILRIDHNQDGESFINMSTGGKLAIFGDADDSLLEFLDLINGADAIRYLDDSISDWSDITDATFGVDYTLEYITDGDLNGYTVLTVGIPEPSAVVIAVVLLGALVFCQQHQEK